MRHAGGRIHEDQGGGILTVHEPAAVWRKTRVVAAGRGQAGPPASSWEQKDAPAFRLGAIGNGLPAGCNGWLVRINVAGSELARRAIGHLAQPELQVRRGIRGRRIHQRAAIRRESRVNVEAGFGNDGAGRGGKGQEKDRVEQERIVSSGSGRTG